MYQNGGVKELEGNTATLTRCHLPQFNIHQQLPRLWQQLFYLAVYLVSSEEHSGI